MTATQIVAINSRLKGKTVQETWDRSWSSAVGHYDYSNGNNKWDNFTADELRKIENDCESKFNTQSEVDKCIRQKKSGSGSGSGNVGDAVNNALNIFNTWQQNKQTGESGYSDTTSDNEPKKSNTGLIIGASVLGVALIGFGVWYFKYRD